MLWLFLSCSPMTPYEAEDEQEKESAYGEPTRALQLIYGSNMDGEIEPCG